MREILFRGKIIELCEYQGQWLEGFYAVENGKPFIAIPKENGLNGFYCDPETVGQYTGLCDKNGTKIFEGDIVETKYGRWGQVIWFSSPRGQRWNLIPLEDKHKCPDDYDLWAPKNLEVIGNIHDNFELLNK